ncbi:MAG: Acetyl-coenzyme synthetase, partial [Thermodesulfobacteriota bacterium]|nr:Acetyl-coenzyme synthetase [Thermodesulfobacteriota bacterium]
WEGDDPGETKSITYAELFESVTRLSGFLKHSGVDKGDTVFIYGAASIEVPIAMLACARIGAVHCVVSPAYSAAVLAERMKRCKAKALIAADGYYHCGEAIPLGDKLDQAMGLYPGLIAVILIGRLGTSVQPRRNSCVWWHDALKHRSARSGALPESMPAEAPLFIIFAAGAIGKPQPLVHTHGGYLLWAAMTSRLALNLRDGDVVWSPGDPSWIASHTLGVYGTLINGVTGVLYEGIPTYPGVTRYWEILSKYEVTKFNISACHLRLLAAHERELSETRHTSCLRIISADDQWLTREHWSWYYDFVGGGRCPVVSTWGQEETGGPVLALLPGVGALKPGSVSKPFFGISPVILDLDTGEKTKFPNQEGAFFIEGPWPGMARSIFGDHSAFLEEYFGPFPGLFITGEGAARDEDGDYWIKGRIDDVMYVDGWRIGSWELESTLVSHPHVSEATVVGYPHPVKGQGLYAFVTLQGTIAGSTELKQELCGWLEMKIGSMVIPDVIQWADDLPKTRSGKILRRLLQRIAQGKVDDLGDLTTVANPEVLDQLIKDRVSVS